MPLRSWLFFGCLLVKNGPRRAMNPIIGVEGLCIYVPSYLRRNQKSFLQKGVCLMSANDLVGFQRNFKNLSFQHYRIFIKFCKILQEFYRILQHLAIPCRNFQVLAKYCRFQKNLTIFLKIQQNYCLSFIMVKNCLQFPFFLILLETEMLFGLVHFIQFLGSTFFL